ncbi:uncharacterized protein LOC9647662 [Selaginella moellendorffii]|uniref:uncharacterized protein LOC9647662 n=1 Tax=Selaginella moellendorffii TaxID=88036 RepID=UPI000D1C6050|nr:uncharacterized protein LOC9647662 [Selaginella moellendorffii]|eukprot:XP_024519713.1 uncharacterized protein LOC9647662 [Selaginella moellendorffii]
MYAISAINESENSKSRLEPLAPTKEAQESHLTKLYQDALSSLQSGDLANARSLFQAIIQDPLSIKSQRGKSDAMLHLRFLTYRNLAETYVKQGPEFSAEGLHYYLQAVAIDDKDVVLWNRLGTLACSLGKLNIARKAFEQGLHCSPRHWSCMEKLVEVLIAIGDETGCISVVKRLLKFHPSHPRALHIKSVIEGKHHGTGIAGMDGLEPTHTNLSFQRKRKLDVVPDTSKRKKRKQYSVQLTLQEPSWLLLVKATLESLQNRQHGKVLKSEELKEKNGCYLANSRVFFSVQGPDGGSSGQTSAKLTDDLLLNNSGCDTVSLAEKISPSKLSEVEDSHAHERRSTRLRSRIKGEEAVADCPKSLTQLLEPFIIDSSRLEVEVDPEASVITHCERVDGSLAYAASASSSSPEGSASCVTVEAREVTQFMQDYANNSGLYHVGHAILERVSSSGIDWKEQSELLLELEKYTRHWGNGRSSRCNLFLAELYLDAASSSAEPGKLLDHCNYNICRVIEWSALEVDWDQENNALRSSSIERDAGWIFWARFHWVYGRYCMLAGNPKKGFSEFRKCLCLLQAQRERYTAIVLPHCKMDKRISLEMAEQKLYEFEVGDLLKNTVAKLDKEEKYLELIKVLEPALFSDRASKTFSGKCTDAMQSQEFKALGMLISACQRVKPANFVIQLKCHLKRLEIFCHCAGVFVKPDDDLSLSPGSAASGEMDDDRAKELRTWSKKIAEEVRLLSRCAAALKKADSSRHVDLPLGRLQNALLAVLIHFGSGFSCRKHSNSSLSENLETSFFVDAAIAFCRVQQLHPALPVEQQVGLLVTVHDILADRGVCAAGASCDEGEGSFLKMAIKHLLSLEVMLKQRDAESENARTQESTATSGSVRRSESLTDLSEKKICESEDLERRKAGGLDKALDQCFFCLYGLNLKSDLESGASSDLAFHKTPSGGDFQSKEQCAAVLQYVLPYAKACSKTGLGKLRKVLQAVRKQFPQPPSNILVGNAVDAFMDDLSFDEDKFSEMVINRTNVDELVSFAFPKQEENPATAVVIYSTPTEEPKSEEAEANTQSYVEVYQNLYFLLSQVEETSPTDRSPGFVFTKEGEEFFEHVSSLFKYDLLYNMLRFESWHKLAGIYDEEVDLLLNDGSKNVNVLEWRKNARLTSRVETSRRRSRRCLLMSLALAPQAKHEIHELLALVYYETLQNTVPSYDQRSHVQKKDALWTSRCLNAIKHCEIAYSLRPDWTHLLYLGKLSEKLEKPSEESFSLYKRAIELNPSAVDSLYRLHRSRLKLLCKGRYHDMQIIETVAKFCYSSSTEELVNSKLKQPDEQVGNEEAYQSDIATAWRALFKDCISAMQACTDGELKHFHKARFCIAQGLYCRAEEQDWERAKEELAFCFRSSRSLFTINMWELDGVIKKNKRKATGHTYAKKTLELGLPESSRKFITCVRKYLLLYFVLCEKAGDYVTLERAYSTLRIDKRFSICLEDIASAALSSYVHALGATITQAESSSSSSFSSLQGLLERMFNLFMDHGIWWAETSESEGQEVAVYCYIHRYLHYLENDCRVDALELVNERIRKRFKHQKLSNPHFSQICRHATVAWCRALCSALASVTPLERLPDHTPQLIVDLQYDVLLFSPYDADTTSKISQVSPSPAAARAEESAAPPASAAYISRIKAVPIVQVSPDNAEKAHSYLRATFVFYREVTSGPFPSGINLFMASPLGAASTEPAAGIQAIPGFDPLDLSTPRKLLLWAFALVHGRAASIADVVKYCEEQAKTRLKKWPTAAATAASHVPSPEKLACSIAKCAEQAVEMEQETMV